MNHDLTKFHHWLLSSTFKNELFEDKIKFQFVSLLSWLIYKDYRDQNSFLKVLRMNKILLYLLSTPFILSFIFFTFGRLTASERTITTEKKLIVQKYVNSLDFKSMKDERRYIEYLAFTKYKIENYSNLQNLTDDVFFTIISEIKTNDIPPSLFFRLLDQESGFSDIKNKNSGASGIPQIMPDTRRYILDKIGTTNHKIIDDIRVSSYHLKVQFDKYKSSGIDEKKSWLLSLVDYNGGSHSLAKENMKYFSSDFN